MLKYILPLMIGFSLEAKLIIHMDVNRTIYAIDSKQNYSLSDLINLSLAKKTVDRWDDNCKKAINFYDYVYLHMLPGERKDKSLRARRRAVVHNFLGYLKEHNHPLYPKLFHQAAQAEVKLEQIGVGVFPSFYRLLDYLKDKESVVIFRTFGGDMEEVRKLLIDKGLEHFPIRHASEFDWQRLPEQRGLLACKDDWKKWSTHNERYEFGKPFPLFEKHPSIFFDDNVEYSNTSNIVAPYKTSDGSFIRPTHAIDKGSVVPVNTFDALMDDDYFVKKIEALLRVAPSLSS